ncbi:ABC transporter ATP-binding protein [Mangrovicella endophytica]|uniref:ABC transporter ATP-binding protein n=1 Tax=Mangrovicella endophytica TaxID=2066697 RepID=UPI0018E4A9C2|nr:ABC transporter ATP-binding protein [Mangrovicella endophytica]
MPLSSSPLVTFSHVAKTYDGAIYVIRDLNFEISDGEFLSLLGPSGSGKTTTLMMLAGFEAPSGGTIRLGDRTLNELPPHKRDIGMVFQNYALFPHMTVAENIAFPLSVRGLSKPEQRERVSRALDMIELGRLGDRKPGQLSGGQQQRVALARALVFEPRLVLMDEPLGALDKALRETMQYEIKRLHHRLGVTVVYVTHDQGEALTMSDRVAVFHGGAIQQIAPPSELYEDPANAFVADFIGENNGIEGEVERLDTGYATLRMPGGRTFRGKAGGDLKAGETAMLALRPERVSVDNGSSEARNQLSGTVEEIIYCGDHRRIYIATESARNFIIKVPNTQHTVLPASGESVRVNWRYDDCKIVSAAQA